MYNNSTIIIEHVMFWRLEQSDLHVLFQLIPIKTPSVSDRVYDLTKIIQLETIRGRI